MSSTLRQGRRVFLTTPRLGDGPEFTDLVRASRAHLGRWVFQPTDAPKYAAYLRRNTREEFESMLVKRVEDGVLLGGVNLSQIFRGLFQNAYLDYWIGAPYARQGYMTEGLALALDYSFGDLRLHRLEANIQPQNLASRRLVASLGFRCEGLSPRYLKIGGRWRDHERWAILREEWKELRRKGRR